MATIRRREGGTNSTILKRREYSTAFSPTSIAGCSLWLDGADPIATGTPPADGTSLSTWSDKSSSGYNAINVNNAATVRTNIQNSNSVIRFNSSRYSVTYPSFPFTGYTFFVVMYLSTNSGSYQRIINGSFSDQYLFIGTNNGSIATFNGNGTWNDINTNSPSISNFQNWRIVVVTVGSSVLTPYVDGTAQNTKTGTTAAFSNLYIGDVGQNYIGDIGEIIVYNSVLSTTQRQTIESYLAQKWGLTGSLPAGHRQFTQPAGKPNTVIDPIIGLYPILKPTTSSPITATVLNTIATYLRNYMSEFRNPSFYGYALDGNSYYINDGGSDMYDAGNWTYPWLISGTQYTGVTGSQQVFSINYSSTTATTVDTDFVYASLGYTQSVGAGILSVHPLTVLGFRTTTGNPVGFQLAGNSGADGGGTLSSSILYAGDLIQGFTVHAFYRETYNATDPSHCNLFILLGHPSWGSVFGTISSFADPVINGGNGCFFYTSGAGVSNILAIQTLLSKAGGVLVTAAECQTVVQAFVNRVKLAVGF